MNNQYDVIVEAEINEKYKIKFFRLRLYFQENRDQSCLVKNRSRTYMPVINFQIYFFGNKPS